MTDPDERSGEAAEIAQRLSKMGKRRPFRWGLVVGLAVAAAVAVFVAQNGHSTSVHWLWTDFRAPVWLLAIVACAAGAIIWETAAVLARRARTKRADRQDALIAAQTRLTGSDEPPT